MLTAFDWRKLTPSSQIEHSFDGRDIWLRESQFGRPLLLPALVAAERAIPCAIEYDDSFSGAECRMRLRTVGAPSTVSKLWSEFEPMIRDVSLDVGVDPRVLLVQAACEAAHSTTEPCGKDPRSPRTELGYPGRTGESDTGDYDRDSIDMASSYGMHSSHGLTQLLIGTGIAVRPDLFVGVPPRFYRDVFAVPRNAFEMLAALIVRARPETQLDPLALRAFFAAGGVYASGNAFGARAYNVSVFLHWLSFWGDAATIVDA